MKHFFQKLLTRIENAPLSLDSFLVAFLALILVRLTVENALSLFHEQSLFFFFFEWSHTLLFFLCSFLIALPIVRLAGGVILQQAANVLLFGFLIILTPPVIDTLIFQGGHFWSFYEFDGLRGLLVRYFTLFGDTPAIGITYGVRIEVVLVTLGLAAYALLKGRGIKRAGFVAFLTYTALFILGTFPSWITILVLSWQKGLLAVTSSDVAGLFLTPENILGRSLSDFRSVLNFKMSLVYGLLASGLLSFFLFRTSPRTFFALWNNARIPQLLYHGGLLLLGVLLAFFFADGRFTFDFFSFLGIILLLIAVECAWLASVIVNDCYDMNIDALTNPDRPLIVSSIPLTHYRTFGILFFLFSLLLAGIVSFSALLLLLSYQALAWIYSAPPLRLKQYPGIATLLASFAGILVLVAGYVSVAPAHNITTLPLSLLIFLFLSYTLALPIKDFKDVVGDKQDGVYTIPVLFGIKRAQYIMGSLLFLLFALSPLILHIRSLFPVAVASGSLAFFSLQKGTADETSFFAFRKLPRIILSLVILYGMAVMFSLL